MTRGVEGDGNLNCIFYICEYKKHEDTGVEYEEHQCVHSDNRNNGICSLKLCPLGYGERDKKFLSGFYV